jgi:hypothetical protein
MKEEFKEFIPGYSVSNMGRIRNDKTGVFRTPQCRHWEHLSVLIKSKNYTIHRLVATHFVVNENPEIYDTVHHKDHNGKNNVFTNLEWCTQKMNHQYALEAGRHTSQTNENFKKQQNEAGKVSKVGRATNSGWKGIQKIVQVRSTKYSVFFNHTGKSRYIGRFDTLEEAKEVYRKLHIDHYGIDPYIEKEQYEKTHPNH